MEIIGKLEKMLPEQRGEGARGPWVKGGFVITTDEQYPKTVAFDLWGEDKIEPIRKMAQGTQLKVYFSAESREFNERWYTSLRCFRVDTFNPAFTPGDSSAPFQGMTEPSSAPFNQQPSSNHHIASTSVEPPIAPAQEGEDDLPF